LSPGWSFFRNALICRENFIVKINFSIFTFLILQWAYLELNRKHKQKLDKKPTELEKGSRQEEMVI
jgi:hypothetical protein